jgi:uncharacterized cupin superfamily protein
MEKLITVVPADKVTAEYEKEAKTWGKWDSKNRKKFPYHYTSEERVLVLDGTADLTPDDGSPVVKIGKGDQVTFHVGFKCKWKITKRMKKHYTVIQDEDAAEPPAISCDGCGADCFAESYFVAEGEEDICPKCYEKDEEKYSGAEHQKEGEKWVEPEKEEAAPKKKKRKTSNK